MLDQYPGLNENLVVGCVRPVPDGTFGTAHGGIGDKTDVLHFKAGERVGSGKGGGHLDDVRGRK